LFTYNEVINVLDFLIILIFRFKNLEAVLNASHKL
jgi:hypothetical protein